MAANLHDLVYAVAEVRHLCEQDVSGDLHTHPWEWIVSGSGVLHGVSGPDAGGWWRMNNLQWAVNLSDAESKDRVIPVSWIYSTSRS